MLRRKPPPRLTTSSPRPLPLLATEPFRAWEASEYGVMNSSCFRMGVVAIAFAACSSSNIPTGGAGGTIAGTGGLAGQTSAEGGSGFDAMGSDVADAPQASPDGPQDLGPLAVGGSSDSGGATGSGGVSGLGGATANGGSGGTGGSSIDAASDFSNPAVHDAALDSSVDSTVADAKTGTDTNPPLCPATYGAGEGRACPLQGTCDYSEGRCGCLPCAPDGGFTGQSSSYWHCRLWTDISAGCPARSPVLNTACSVDGLACDYSQCCGGPSLGPGLQCTGGRWQLDPLLIGVCSCAIRLCP